MKKAINLAKKHIGGINELILSLYTAFVFSSYSFIANGNAMAILRSVFLWTVLSFVICPVLLRFLKKTDTDKYFKNINEDVSKKNRLMFYLLPAAVFLFYYITFYPGGFSPDIIAQYAQAVNNRYNDWHPILQTLIAIKLPLLLTGGWEGAPALFQLLLFSLVIGYSLNRIMDYSNKKVAVFSLVFILINPQIDADSVIVWKDSTFAAFAMLLTTFLLNIVCTKGEWIKKPLNTVLFIITAAVLTLLRHNAILFTLPVLIAVFLYISKKRGILIILCTVLLVAGVKYPLYDALNIEKNGSRGIETLGMPINVIGAVAVKDTDALDSEIQEFVFKIAPKKVWESQYQIGNYNIIKNRRDTHNEIIEQYGAKKVIPYMLRCIAASPIVSIKAMVKLTDPVYTLCDDYVAKDHPYVTDNDFGIQSKEKESLKYLVYLHIVSVNVFLPYLTVYIGAVHFLLLVFVLSKYRLKSKKDLKRTLLVLPVFIYNFGTALLLTSYHDSTRFFMYTFMIAPTLMVMINKKET